MSASRVEAGCDETLYAKVAHVAERHRWAGRLLRFLRHAYRYSSYERPLSRRRRARCRSPKQGLGVKSRAEVGCVLPSTMLVGNIALIDVSSYVGMGTACRLEQCCTDIAQQMS